MRAWPLLLCACAADSPAALQIMGVLAPPQVVQSPETPVHCAYQASPGALFLSSGSLDVAFAKTYTATLGLILYRNDAATLDSADVRVTDSGGTPVSAFSTPASGTITASGGTTTVTLVDATSAADITGALAGKSGFVRLLTYVTIHGHAADGSALLTNELEFPIEGCSGCLVQFPLGSDDTTKAQQPNCAAPLPASELVPCIVGQDQPIDCRTCQSNPVCVP